MTLDNRVEGSAKADKAKKTVAVLKLAVLVFIIVGVPLILYFKYGDQIFTKDAADNIIEYLQSHKSQAVGMILILQILQVIICILPGQPIQFAASYMFGVFWALIISLSGALIGATISFGISKVLGQDAMHLIFGKEKIRNYREKLNSAKGISVVLLIYLIPGIPKDLTAYAAGISEMRFLPFIIASSIGRTPSMLCSILFALFYKTRNIPALIVLSVLVVIVVVICIIKRKEIYAYLDKVSSQKKLESETGSRDS